MLSNPRQHEILPSPIQSKVWACLATRFNVRKNVIQSVVKLDQPIIQYGRVTRLKGGDPMVGHDLVKETEDSRDASFVRVESSCVGFAWAISEHSFLQYTQLVDRYACQRNIVPVFEVKHFFGQLKCILVLELPSAPRLNLATLMTIILAVIQNAKATLTNETYYYKELGVEEVVDLTTVQCVVGRIKHRGEWAIVDRSNVAIQMD